MTLYVTMVNDRHSEPEAFLFSAPEKAIAVAQSILDERGFSNEDDVERMSEADLQRAGWLFSASYSVEGDGVWVLPKEVDEE